MLKSVARTAARASSRIDRSVACRLKRGRCPIGGWLGYRQAMDQFGHDVDFQRQMVGDHARQARSLCLDDRDAQPLMVRREQENVHRMAKQIRHLVAGARKHHAIVDAEGVDVSPNLALAIAIPDKEKASGRLPPEHLGSDLDDQRVILALVEASDVT